MLFDRSTSTAIVLLLAITTAIGQAVQPPTSQVKETDTKDSALVAQKVVVVTGARFSYKLVEKWIDEYSKVNPGVQIIVESRGSADPLKYDILAEVYPQDEGIRNGREYVNIGRYAILPAATSGSAFAKTYAEKGLNADAINEIFFHSIFADKGKEKPIAEPFTVYTRLQKAGVPIVFARYFGHEQKDFKGTAIAGADSHLLKALLRDSIGVSYLPVPLIYDERTRKPVEGLTVLPVDLNGNKRVNEEEKFYGSLDSVIEHLESLEPRQRNNIPVEYLHLSVDAMNASTEAIQFLRWVNANGQKDLHDFGYLKPEPKRFEQADFEDFASSQQGR
jgi:phosphate transport system substrate-binding protein